MLFRELTFKDFLVFKGTNYISFPAPNDNASCLLLVLAPNNGGKTSIIRALEFLLYGKLRREMPATADGLINKAYVRAGTSTTLEAWVQAKIEIDGNTRTIRRRIQATRAGSAFRTRIILEETVHARRGDEFKEDEGSIQRTLERLVPESLFDYFYFQGETLAERLIRGTGNDAIREGLATLLHQDKWQDAIATVDQVRRKLSNEIENLAVANKEYTKKSTDLENLRKLIRDTQQEARESKAREEKAQQQFNEAEEQIKALGTGEAHKALTSELNRKRSELKTVEHRFGQLNSNIAATIAGSKGLPFFQAAFAPALKLLEQMRKENILPADIAAPFVTRLLNGDLCICGRPLQPEEPFAKERACIAEYRDRTLAADLNSGLLDLLNQLERGTRQNFNARLTGLRNECDELLSERAENIITQHDLKEAIKDLEDKRAKSNIEAIVEQQAKQRDAATRMSEEKGQQGELTMQVRNLELREKNLKRELDEMGRRGAGPQLRNLHGMRERAHELQNLIEQSLAQLKSSFHTMLQRSVRKYYDTNVTDNSKAFIDPKTLLPSIRRNGEILPALGGGQSQMLALAHIISLAELRRDLHRDLDALGIKTGKLDDQSFFLDSIFAPCDPVYARIVAAFLPQKARQMMLLVARQQWYDEVRSQIEPHAQKVFLIKLHTNNPDRHPDEYEFPFKRRKYNLLAKIPANEEPYSIIEEAE